VIFYFFVNELRFLCLGVSTDQLKKSCGIMVKSMVRLPFRKQFLYDGIGGFESLEQCILITDMELSILFIRVFSIIAAAIVIASCPTHLVLPFTSSCDS
jgi:hypothetical protein